MLGLEADVNQSTAAEMTDEAFRGRFRLWRCCWPGILHAISSASALGGGSLSLSSMSLNARDEETELAVQVQLLQAGC